MDNRFVRFVVRCCRYCFMTVQNHKEAVVFVIEGICFVCVLRST